jgi:hypothetical protein
MKSAENSPISYRIKHIYDNYYGRRAIEKFSHICRQCDEFCNGLDFDDKFQAYYADFTIRAMVESYYLDVIRYKEYHFNPSGREEYNPGEPRDWIEAVHHKKISKNKVAAYSAKWLLHYSPITIIPDEDHEVLANEQQKILNVNAMFCIVTIRNILAGESSTISEHFMKEEIIADMVYHFRFRTFDERHFFMVLDPFREMMD